MSEGLRHALQETQKPVVEVSFYNLVANGETSVITPTVIGRAMGLRQYSYLAGLLALVLSLDDATFLNPTAPNRSRFDAAVLLTHSRWLNAMTGANAFPTVEWSAALGQGLKAFRSGEREWHLCLIDGPNMSNLAREDGTRGLMASLPP